MIVFTSICANYLPKALSLAKSVKSNVPDSHFCLCLLEREIHPLAEEAKEFDDVFLATEIGFQNFDQFIFRHSIVEAATAVKAQVFKYLFEKYGDERYFVYLDPDIIVYSDLVELREELVSHPIILCPHLLEPGNIDMEFSCLQHGVYNLGFLAVSRNQEALRFIEWWAERLFWYCHDDKPRGVFTDQKWIDLAPSFFDAYILKHRGYDFATWSLLNSQVSFREGRYFVHGDELRFVHYSGYDSGVVEWAMRKWLPDESNSAFRDLYRGYVETLELNGQSIMSKVKWSYDSYDSGKKISRRARLIARRQHEDGFLVDNPFKYGNIHFYCGIVIWYFSAMLRRVRQVFRILH